MRILYNPKTATALTAAPADNNITFDLAARKIYVKGVTFDGTDHIRYLTFLKHTSGSTGGRDGLVPAPAASVSADSVLKADGSWSPITSLADTKVTQSESTTGEFRTLLLSYTKKATAPITDVSGFAATDLAYFAKGLYVQPSTGSLFANKLYSGGQQVLTSHQDLSNYVTLNTAQTISAAKTFTSGLIVSGRPIGAGDDEGIVIRKASNNYAGVTLGDPQGLRSTFYLTPTNDVLITYNDGTGGANVSIKHPKTNGTIATQEWVNNKNYLPSNANAVSATKLQTARTIWGQLFDGTANVDGVFRSLTNATNGQVLHSILKYPTSPYGLLTRIYDSGMVSLQSQRETTTSEYFGLSLNPLGGNVGIGTTSPAYKLDVNGAMRASGLITGTAGANFYGARVRIGCNDPDGTSYPLHHRLDMGYHSDDHLRIYEVNVDMYINGGTTQYARISVNDSYFNGTGNVGIGTTSPAYRLDVYGSTRVNGGKLVIQRSDADGNVVMNGKQPEIQFIAEAGTSQYASLIYCDHDTYKAPDSLSLVSNQPGTFLIAPNILANLSLFAKDNRFNNYLAYYNTSTPAPVGALVISFPNSWKATMATYEIDVYEYNSRGASKIICGGYDYTDSNGYWVNTSITVIGDYTYNVRFGYYNGKCCIVLGDFNTTWSYPQVWLKSVETGFGRQTDWASNNYSITLVSNSSLVTKLNTPVIKRTSYRDDVVIFKYNPADISNNSPAADAKTHWSNELNQKITAVYNNKGVEYAMLFAKAGNYGTVLSWTYADNYLRILRNNNGTWLSTDWEKISAGYADWASCLHTKGTNTITNTTNDTTAKWGEHYTSIHWYTATGLLINQPSQYGYILNVGSSSEVHQLWMTQPSGNMYHRGGNASGWNGTWRRIIDSVNISPTLNWTNATSASAGSTLSVTVGGITSTAVTINKVRNAFYADSAGTVTVNNSDSNSTYRMVWHSGNTLYSTAGIYCNPSSDYLYASGFVKSDSSNSYVLLGGGGHKAVSDFATSGHNHDGRYLQYNGWWSSGSGQNVDNALGMIFSYTNHNAPSHWGTTVTFEYQLNSAYRLQLHGTGNNQLWFRNRSVDYGGWHSTGWQRVVTNSGTWNISISGNAATATKLNTTRKLWGQDFNGTADVNGTLTFTTQSGSNALNILYGCIGDNDYFRVRAGATSSNNGYLEIATADDGNEPIYVRQYTGVFASVKRTLTLLDANGYSYFPSYINIGGNEGNNSSPNRVWGSNGSDTFLRSYLTSALRVAYATNADTVDGVHVGTGGAAGRLAYYSATTTISSYNSTLGGTARGMYLNAGVPTALSATVGNASAPVYMNGGTITACKVTSSGSWRNYTDATNGIRGRVVIADNVTEIGRYLDFHANETTAKDYEVRLACPDLGTTATNTAIATLPSISGTLVVGSGTDGYLTAWHNSGRLVRSALWSDTNVRITKNGSSSTLYFKRMQLTNSFYLVFVYGNIARALWGESNATTSVGTIPSGYRPYSYHVLLTLNAESSSNYANRSMNIMFCATGQIYIYGQFINLFNNNYASVNYTYLGL